AIADVFEHCDDVCGPLCGVAHQRHHRPAPHPRLVPAPEAMLDSAAVTVARHELVKLEANAVVSLEVVRERLAMQTAGRVVAYPFQHGIRLQDPAVQAERHDADGCSIEDRPKLSLARCK